MRCDSLRGFVISSEFAKKKREEMKKQMSKKALELQEQKRQVRLGDGGE